MKDNIPATSRIELNGQSFEYALSGAGRPILVLLNGAGMPLWS
ncbi:MAG: hypothetical protein ACR2O4_09105 [Hyphomicrobiaceae bacterium]